MKLQIGATIILLSFLSVGCSLIKSETFKKKEAKIYEYVEWSVTNDSYTGNPFDVVAKVNFEHKKSGKTHTTEMFYDGGDTWKFRFTGTKTGKWDYVTRADGDNGTNNDPELDNLTGTVDVKANPGGTGFLQHRGNQYGIQTGDDGTLKGYVFNVYMSEKEFSSRNIKAYDNELIDAYCADTKENGFEVLFIHVVNNFFKLGTIGYNEHQSSDPDPSAFEKLEQIISRARKNGCRIMFWAWGDESRKWTPVGVGDGINGKADRRLQRYIAARLGPIAGWSMGYGFDLSEWVNRSQLRSWQEYMHEHMGWQHLLSARATDLKDPYNINGYAIEDREIGDFYGPAYPDMNKIIDQLNSDKDNPHLYEERHTWQRWGLNEAQTRRLVWRTVMAGGMGGWYGFMDFQSKTYPVSLKEALRTHYEFWHQNERYRLDFNRANELTDGWCLKTSDNSRYIVYKENSDKVRVDLSDMPQAQEAFAVNVAVPYKEIDLGTQSPEEQTIRLKDNSDWVIAIGY